VAATPDEVLDPLDPEQRAVATALTGPVCVLAGAGTGKTRAITSRIAYGMLAGVFAPSRVLAVTFTTRAAGEMRGRLRTLGVTGVQARTFHSAALRQLAYFYPRVVGGELPRILDSKVGVVAEALSRCRLPPDRALIRDVAAEIEWAKVSQVAHDDYAARAEGAGRVAPGGLTAADVACVYAAYDEGKRRRGLVDFEDVLLLTVAVLDEQPEVAEAVRGQYHHFVVDEYQDVNPLQQRLLELWLGDRDSVCVVGDASQTIYSFTGASPRYLLEFTRRHPTATVVRLVRDYRSTPQVVGLANALLKRGPGVPGGTRLQLVAQRLPGPEPTFTAHADEQAEAQAVADRIRDLLAGGTPASEVAVLFRINAQSEAYEQALADAGISYVLRGAERFFERPEVRQAVTLLRGAARGGAPTGDGLAEEVRAVLATTGWTVEPPAGGATRERWESLAALAHLADELVAARPGAALTDLVAELDERAAAQHVPTVQGVTLASLHAAKGLEWDAVFIVGLTDGMLPISYAVTPEQVEEERRLLYVGVTRAREHLALSWSAARAPGGRGGRRPSRFLDGLLDARGGGGGEAVAAGTADRRTGGRRRGPARCRVCGRPLAGGSERKLGRCAGCPSSADAGLFNRLRDWRLATAREQGMPAFVVFTDATLTAIAEARPGSRAELARIPGVGAAKLERFADAVLDLCADAGDGHASGATEPPIG